jgi:hypothetical protein
MSSETNVRHNIKSNKTRKVSRRRLTFPKGHFSSTYKPTPRAPVRRRETRQEILNKVKKPLPVAPLFFSISAEEHAKLTKLITDYLHDLHKQEADFEVNPDAHPAARRLAIDREFHICEMKNYNYGLGIPEDQF